MARLNVNPTRMVLTNLKKQMKVAVRGHKLMKDKRDELMKGFLELARENKELRQKVEAQLAHVYDSFSIASAAMSREMMEEALMYPKQGVELSVGSRNIMSYVFCLPTPRIFPETLHPAPAFPRWHLPASCLSPSSGGSGFLFRFHPASS